MTVPDYPSVTVTLPGTYSVLRLHPTGQVEALWGRLPRCRPSFLLFADELPPTKQAPTLSITPGQFWAPVTVPRPAGRRVEVPTFEMLSNPTIRISEVRQRRFDIIDRATVQVHDISFVSNPLDPMTAIVSNPLDPTTAIKPDAPPVVGRSVWQLLLEDDVELDAV